MIQLSDLEHTARMQQEALNQSESYERDLLREISVPASDFALIISGIRRCGKSTLLNQIMQREGAAEAFTLNFDNIRLYGFTAQHFTLIDEILRRRPEVGTLYFDEIQVVDGWEIYVRNKLSEGYRVVVTGSNSSMLSRELGSKLTGRHLSKELFPFSLKEYCGFKGVTPSHEAMMSYLDEGGFPLYLKTANAEVLSTLVDDILYRDIAVRYNLRDEMVLKRLMGLLLGNVGNLVTASKLKQLLRVGSTTTVSDYLSYFEQSYLISLVPKFSYSQKSQLANPRKIYCIDNAIAAYCSPSTSSDIGHRLENCVYGELRRRGGDIFYYNEAGRECDFVVIDRKGTAEAIQVCYQLDALNRGRETEGLLDAMNHFGLSKGQIITAHQSDLITIDGKRIEVTPAHEALG